MFKKIWPFFTCEKYLSNNFWQGKHKYKKNVYCKLWKKIRSVWIPKMKSNSWTDSSLYTYLAIYNKVAQAFNFCSHNGKTNLFLGGLLPYVMIIENREMFRIILGQSLVHTPSVQRRCRSTRSMTLPLPFCSSQSRR